MTKAVIHKPTKTIVLEYDQRINDVIPKSRVVEFKGKKFTTVFHGEDEVLALKQFNIDVKPPMLYYYDWPKAKGIHTMMPHQKEAASFMSIHKKCFNLSEPRTGKTYSILMTFDYLRKIGKVDQLIIYSTLSTLNSVWVQSIFDTFHWYSCSVVHGSDKEAALNADVDILIINHDGVKTLEAQIKAKDRITMVAWDEADVLCNSQTAMWKSFRNTIRPDQYVVLATGTPTGDGQPTAAWALAKLISPHLVPKYFGAFKRMTMTQITQFKWVPKRESSQIVYEALQPAICFRKKDVLKDIPDVIQNRVECELSEEQDRMVKDIKKDMMSEYAEGSVSAVNAADKMTKLLQIFLGSFRMEDGEYFNIDCSDRFEKIKDCIRSAKKKVIIFVPWKGALRYYHKELNKEFKCAFVDGEVGKKARDKIFYEFEHGKTIDILLAQQKTTAHGLEFSCADVIIWAGPPHSGRQFMQANERNNSIKQDTEMNTYYIGANKIEWLIYDRLLEKKGIQENVLDLYKKVIKEIEQE